MGSSFENKAEEADEHKQSTVANFQTTENVAEIEAPVTWKAYLMCAFASFGGIFFGYDSGYINGVNGSLYFIHKVEGTGRDDLTDSHTSLITSILSCGTFFGALIAGDLADRIGRKWTVISGCIIYCIGVVIQMITGEGDALAAIVAGRLIAGIGVGFESAIVILYMSEIVSLSRLLLPSAANIQCSAPARFVVLSSLATNSASPSVSCLPLASSTAPRTSTTPTRTVFLLRSSSPGLSSSVAVSCSSPTLLDTTSRRASSMLPSMP